MTYYNRRERRVSWKKNKKKMKMDWQEYNAMFAIKKPYVKKKED